MAVRYLYLTMGWLAIALGVLGVALPVLPTTPFILLAAWCFAKGSPRCHQWLRNNRYFGQMVQDWERQKGLRRRYRRRAVVMMLITFSISLMIVPKIWLKVMLVAIMVSVLIYLYRLPVIEDEQ